jgi:hypothetical protein
MNSSSILDDAPMSKQSPSRFIYENRFALNIRYIWRFVRHKEHQSNHFTPSNIHLCIRVSEIGQKKRKGEPQTFHGP